MRHSHWAWAGCVTLGALVALAAGCGGRPTLPGRQFRGERAITSTSPPPTSPLPEKPYLEWGPASAKVRLVAFFPLDEAHQKVMDLVKGLAEQYPGKVYVKYVDYRTQEGRVIYQRSEMDTPGVMINGESSVMIEAKPYSYQVDFLQEMGRFWTADDLKAAVAQAVARAYGAAGGGKKGAAVTR